MDPALLAVETDGTVPQVVLAGPEYAEWLSFKRLAYQARVEATYGAELDLEAAPSGPELDLVEPGRPIVSQPGDEVVGDPGGGGSLGSCPGTLTDAGPDGMCKRIFGTDSRTLVSGAQSYPNSKFVKVVMDHHTNGSNAHLDYPICSGTFVDEDHVLTAAHCVFDHVQDCFYSGFPNDKIRCRGTNFAWQSTPYGVDKGLGYVCLSGYPSSGAMFADDCEFVSVTQVAPAYPSGGALEDDYALLTLSRANHPNGLGAGRWMALSGIDSAATLETKTAVSQGYPLVAPDGEWNQEQRTFFVNGERWELGGARQYKTYGSIASATTSNQLHTYLEASDGQSGSSIFYFTDDDTVYTGQSHFIIGIAAAISTYTSGPTVKRFRDFVTTNIQ
ncbi:MAG: trypsin-like serine protease [Deltaproteobacteria bacterium]|nr:trypsin-like serine protease [Deltaproteobacteria bacterium]